MNKKFIIIIALLVGVGLAVFFVSSSNKDTNQSPDVATNQNSSSSEQVTSDNDGETVTIFYTDNGFEPSEYTVNAGTKVTVQNNSNGVLQFSSDDHPVHKDNPELNTQTISAGESVEFTPTKTGTWGFHDHINDDHTGTLIVE